MNLPIKRFFRFSTMSPMRRNYILPAVVLFFWILYGCSNSGSGNDAAYLVRVGERAVTVVDFNKAFEMISKELPEIPNDSKMGQALLGALKDRIQDLHDSYDEEEGEDIRPEEMTFILNLEGLLESMP